MLDPDTFLPTVYVMADTFCTMLPPAPQPGPMPSLSRREVITLALFGQWAHVQSERDLYRYAKRHLWPAFPALPNRAQFPRRLRAHRDALSTFAVYLAGQQGAHAAMYEALRCSGVPTRNTKRRGAGWLAGMTDIGWINRLGWYDGLHLLPTVTPNGVITGFGVGAAGTKDQALADTFFALRQSPSQQMPSVGQPAIGPYVAERVATVARRRAANCGNGVRHVALHLSSGARTST